MSKPVDYTPFSQSKQNGNKFVRQEDGVEALLTDAIESSSSNASQRDKSQSTLLVELAVDSCFELFHAKNSSAGCYARIAVGKHLETCRIGSNAFRLWLLRLYWESCGGAPNSSAMQDAVGVLRGKALFEGAKHPVSVRLGELNGCIYLDLANDEWQAVEIDAQGWRIIDRPPVRFIRTSGMLPLPMPKPGARLAMMRPFLNVENDDDWLLICAWLVSTLRPSGPFPALGIHGEQGAAKTSTCRILRALVDPNEAPLRSGPKNERDLVIAASNSWMVSLENMSKLPDWLSDALCRLSTGGGFGTRELYSDDEETLFCAKRPILMNGIAELATRSDLLDRSIVVTLPRIADHQRRTEKEIAQEFAIKRPLILGALLDAVSTALAGYKDISLQRLPRMADFATWACAAEPAFDCQSGAFLYAYQSNVAAANESAIDSSVIAVPLLAFLNGKDKWRGTASDLLHDLEKAAFECVPKRVDLPKKPHLLSGELMRIAPNLRRIGWDVERGRVGGSRFIQITKITTINSVDSVHSVNDSEKKSDIDAAGAIDAKKQPISPEAVNDLTIKKSRTKRIVI